MLLLPASALTAAQLTVKWDDNSRNELGFKIERSTNGKNFSIIAIVKANQTSYTDTKVTPATTYWYRVKAYDLLRSSGYSNVTSAKTPAAAPAPAKPANPATSGGGNVASSPKPSKAPPATAPKPPTPQPPATKPAPAPAKPVATTTKPAPATPPAAPATKPAAARGRIKAFTARAETGAADLQSLVLTFTTTGSSKPILLRAIGPGLSSYTSAKTLPDPKLKLSTGSLVLGNNDNWGGGASLSSQFKQAGAFPLSASSKDAALWRIIGSGSYTSVVNGAASGLAQTEVYDVDTSSAPTGRFSKLAVRAPVKTGSSVLVGGFVVADAPVRVLIRAIGPGLKGINGVMKDPVLTIHRGDRFFASNNNWGGGPALASAFKQIGATSLSASSKDAAIIVTLSPGIHTATVSGNSNSTGLAQLEFYLLP